METLCDVIAVAVHLGQVCLEYANEQGKCTDQAHCVGTLVTDLRNDPRVPYAADMGMSLGSRFHIMQKFTRELAASAVRSRQRSGP
jgi:hypothetical protein